MIVENESNWRTEDIEALLKSITEQESFKRDYGVYDSTLLLFTTSRKKPKKDLYDDEIVKEPKAADYEPNPKAYYDTKVVKIRSAKKLEMELLDKLAHIGECVQHMSTANVVELAKAIWVCVGREYFITDEKVEFAKTMNMRVRSKVTRSKVALERQIAALEWQQNRAQSDANRKIKKLAAKISAVRAKIYNM